MRPNGRCRPNGRRRTIVLTDVRPTRPNGRCRPSGRDKPPKLKQPSEKNPGLRRLNLRLWPPAGEVHDEGDQAT